MASHLRVDRYCLSLSAGTTPAYFIGGSTTPGEQDIIDYQYSQRHIPAAGYSGLLTSYITSFKYMINAESVLYDGYKKARLTNPRAS